MSTATSQIPMQIQDLQAGMNAISRLPLGNPQDAYAYLKSFLDSLLKAPPRVDDYLILLEHLSHILCFVTEELARCFINKPLPLVDLEEDRFRQVIIIWIKMARSYACCAKLVALAPEPAQPSRIALILHRCIFYTGMALFEHHRSCRELPRELWHDLHGYYASAEKRGVETLAIRDVLDHEASITCQSTYLRLLLSELASPYSLSVRDQNLVRRWANIWSPLVSLHSVLPGEAVPKYAVDLTHNVGLRSTTGTAQIKHLRRLESSGLSQHLKHLRQQLRQKISPAELGLGDGFSPQQCKRLLQKLSHPWSQAETPRKYIRRTTSGEVKLGIGLEAAYHYLSGKPFPQVEKNRSAPGKKTARQAPRHEESPALPDFVPDQWTVLNQSASGFRLRRGIDGEKIAHGQLLALCPLDGKQVFLGQTTWLMQERKGALVTGVAVLPGIPQAIAARLLTNEIGPKEANRPAFILSAVPSINQAPTLVIPQGWYSANRLIEIHTDSVQRVKLKQLINEGLDFEQVSFVVET
ncbi:MAG: hypothetical protein WCK63_12905 [Betaproteobacteria bacterium]